MRNRFGVWSVVLAAAFVLGSAMPSQALDRDDARCRHRIDKAERNLNRAIRRHGPQSPQAERRRQQLEEARQRCAIDRH